MQQGLGRARPDGPGAVDARFTVDARFAPHAVPRVYTA